MRGKELDETLEKLLAEMLAKGEGICRPALQKKLGLSSRSTLSGKRAKIIDAYRDKQLKQLDASDSKYHRLSLQERCQRLTEDKKRLEKCIDELTEQLQKIVVNTEKYGLSPEKILEPLAPKRR
jgi:hypothetical protein